MKVREWLDGIEVAGGITLAGYFPDPFLDAEVIGLPCKTCGGSKVCPDCEGDGKCPFCHAEGVTENLCGPTELGSVLACGRCGPNGTCPTCDGTGACPDCAPVTVIAPEAMGRAIVAVISVLGATDCNGRSLDVARAVLQALLPGAKVAEKVVSGVPLTSSNHANDPVWLASLSWRNPDGPGGQERWCIHDDHPLLIANKGIDPTNVIDIAILARQEGVEE